MSQIKYDARDNRIPIMLPALRSLSAANRHSIQVAAVKKHANAYARNQRTAAELIRNEAERMAEDMTRAMRNLGL